MESKSKALAIVRAASDKKALDIVTLDMRKIPSVSDYFVIASGSSTTQVRAISDNIADVLRQKGQRVRHIEGAREALWVLLDCGDVVAHVFLDKTRRFYELEKLWDGVPRKSFSEARAKPCVRARARPKRVLKRRRKR